MSKKLQTRVVQLLGRLRGHLDTYRSSMRQEVGPTLSIHVSRARQVLQNIEDGFPGVLEMLQENPSHMSSLQREEAEWGSVVLVDLLMEVFVMDIVLCEPPQTVALILTTFFQDILSDGGSPDEAFYAITGNLVLAFAMPHLARKYKWGDPKPPLEKASYRYFISVVHELLLLSRVSSSSATIPDSNSDSRSRTL